MKPNLQQLLQSAQKSLGSNPTANPSAQMTNNTPPNSGPPLNLPDLSMHPQPSGYTADHHARFNASPFGMQLRQLIHGKK